MASLSTSNRIFFITLYSFATSTVIIYGNSLLISPVASHISCDPGKCKREPAAGVDLPQLARPPQNFLRLEGIRDEILSKLGLHAPPEVPVYAVNISNIKPLAKLITEQKNDYLDHGQMSKEELPFKPETIIIFGNSTFPTDLHFRSNQDGIFFPVPHGKLRAIMVDKALLWVYIRPARCSNENGTEVILRVYTLHREGSLLSLPGKKLIDQKLVVLTCETGKWVAMPFTKPLSIWVTDYLINEGVYIEAKDSRGENYAVAQSLPGSVEYQNAGPYLEVRLNRHHGVGFKEVQQPLCSFEQPSTQCCRYPLKVSFKEPPLGWDFVYSPREYMAYYCAGRCTTNVSSLNVSGDHGGHVTSTTPLHETTATAKSCCVPIRQSHQKITYRDDKGDIISGKLLNMVVEECGCRTLWI